MTSRLFGQEYTRGAVMRAVKEDIRTQEMIDRIDEQEVRDAQGPSIANHNMHATFGKLDYLHDEYENYSWKVSKDGDAVGIEDPKNRTKACLRPGTALTMLAGAGTTYDPYQKERAQLEVLVIRRKVKNNGA
jgi:hypothetical protein